MSLDLLRRRRWSLAWLLGIVAVGIGLAVLVTVPFRAGVPSERSLVGQLAPPLAATDLEGRTWTLADADGRIVWVNFWATWCEPCRTEMPAMQRLAEEHAEDLLVLGVDWGEGRDAVMDFVERYAIDYPIILDPTLETFYAWAARDGLPRHYFVGSDGTVVREVIGPLEPAAMLELLDELLAEA